MNFSARYFPHRAAGFRSNPFRALTDAEWADCAIVGAEIEAAFTGTTAHLQVLGSIGAGKTTTLLGLKRRAQESGARVAYEYLVEGQDHLTVDLATCSLLLIDEAQRLARSELVRLLDWCSRSPRTVSTGSVRLVVASHDDLARHFAARRLPLVTASVNELTSAASHTLLNARLAAVALPGLPHATLSDDAVSLLMETYGTDRRAAIALLYEVFQRLRAPVTIDAEAIRAALYASPATDSDAPGSSTACSSPPGRSNSRCSRAARGWSTLP